MSSWEEIARINAESFRLAIAERDQARSDAKSAQDVIADFDKIITVLRIKIEGLEAALRPFARDLHQDANFHYNFGVIVNGPTPDRFLISLLASDFDAARAALAEPAKPSI